MDKDIRAILAGYETIAFASVEPLDGSSYSIRHVVPLKNVVRKKA